MTHQVHGSTKSHVRTGLLALAAGSALALPHAAQAQEDPAPMLQWFECRFADMERRMPDFFMSGWGSVWLPPVSKGYISPRDANQNSFSAGYDPPSPPENPVPLRPPGRRFASPRTLPAPVGTCCCPRETSCTMSPCLQRGPW